MSAINETLIRDVVADVMGRLNGGVVAPKTAAAPSQADLTGKSPASAAGSGSGRGKHGVFQDANQACAAAQDAFVPLREKGVAARAKIVEIVKTMAEANAVEWGRIELEETKIGRLDHKIEKLKIIKLVPGVEWLNPYGRSGDHGIMLEEYTPFGVVAAITPSTHSISGHVERQHRQYRRRRQHGGFQCASRRREMCRAGGARIQSRHRARGGHRECHHDHRAADARVVQGHLRP